MKRAFFITITALLFIISTRAQTTSGTEFWLTFGKNGRANQMESMPALQIRIVCGDFPTSGSIRFFGLTGSQATVSFNLGPREVMTYPLNDTQRDAAYNVSQGKSNKSIYIQSNKPITAYAINLFEASTDATNLFPTLGLGTDYYQISYKPTEYDSDAYAVIATKDATNIYQNGVFLSKLNQGEVYYQTSLYDMTGMHITSDHDKPVVFFALNQDVFLPHEIGTSRECFMQQLAPVNTWGKKFFVPVSSLTNNTKDRVRIVASEDYTTFKTLPTGVTIITNSGGQSPITKPLLAGEFFELEVTLANNGCYFETDKPVGVCAYLTSANYNDISFSDPAQAWLPSMEQTVTESLIVPFIAVGSSVLQNHYALIIAPTETKLNTLVTIGNGSPQVLSGATWHDNPEAGKSFYAYPMTNPSASFCFKNPGGIIVLGYGTGEAESYYYLAYSAIRNLQSAFYANDIYFLELQTHALCKGEVTFRAEVTGMSNLPGSLKWYLDDIEQTQAQDMLIWSKYFDIGTYNIKMMVRYSEEDSIILESTLDVGYEISASVSPTEGGYIDGTGCYATDREAILTALPNFGYNFEKWTENEEEVSTKESYKFTVTGARDLTAHFVLKTYDIVLSANPPEGGTLTGEGNSITHGTSVTVVAAPSATYKFVNWTEKGVVVSTNASYTFDIMDDRNLIANFTLKTYDVSVAPNPEEGGIVTGNGNDILHGSTYTVLATSKIPYHFVNWTEDGTIVSVDSSYTFIITDSRKLVANFEKTYFNINVEVNNPEYGYATGEGDYIFTTTAQVEAFANNCYLFANWTIDSVVVSTDNPYIFTVTHSVNLVANFLGLDFDTCTLTLWNNTFLLNLRWLRENGYEVSGCRWFKNGIELLELNTIDEYSYCAGTNGDLLEPAPTYYTFQINTNNFGCINSTKKMITHNSSNSTGKLLVYPNPVSSGAQFTIEGVSKNSLIYVYNFMGVCVGSAIATDSTAKLSLNLPAGIYLIRSENKEAKIVIVE